MSLHVECGAVLTDGYGRSLLSVEQGGGLAWSETLASAGTTTNTVPAGGPQLVLTLTAEVDMWVSIGASADATQNPRRRLKAGVTRSFLAIAGHRVSWAA